MIPWNELRDADEGLIGIYRKIYRCIVDLGEIDKLLY